MCLKVFFYYRALIWNALALQPLLCGTWILGLLFLLDSDSEALAWIFTLVNSLQVIKFNFHNVRSWKEFVTNEQILLMA